MEMNLIIKPKILMKVIAVILTSIMILQLFPAIVFGVQQSANSNNNIEQNTTDNQLVSNSEIVGEIVEKRTLNQKHFLQEDGNIITNIYPSNIHYEENGQLIDINNSLEESNEDGGIYKNIANAFQVKFAKKANEKNLIKLKIKNHNIQWSLQNSNKVNAIKTNNKETKEKFELKNISSGTVEYKDILNGIDLQYNIISNSIKENIILKDKESIKQQITFEFKTDNLKMEKTQDGRITFCEKDKESVLFFLEEPYMYDAKGEISNDIELKLEEQKNKYILTIIPNKEWLQDEKREYPITIDPTVETSLNYENIQDTYIFNGDTGYPNRHEAHILRVGSNNTLASKNPTRSLIKFTLPDLNSGDQVIYAMLDICSYPDSNEWNPPSGEIQIDAHKMIQDWNSSSANWIDLNNKYDARIVDYAKYQYDTNNPAKFYYFDITSMVKDWYVTGNNYGLVLKDHTEIYNASHSDVYFFSADVNSAYINARPMVQIVYRNQTGLETYQTYHTQTIGRAGTIHTNDYNGNVTLLHYDASTPGQNLSVSVNHVYNTNDRNIDIGYGNGYRLNITQTIEKVVIGSKEYAKYTDEDGTKHYFEKQGDKYIDSENLGLKLTIENEKFILTDKSNNKFIFTKKTSKLGDIWFLTQLVDSNNNIITISLIDDSNVGARVSKISDSSGDSISFTYDNNKLNKIIDKSSKSITYQYDNEGNLIKITYQDGKFSQYVYKNKLLTSIKNIDNYHVNYEYYNEKSNRLKSIKEYSANDTLGNSLNISYGNNITKFTDNENYSNTYTFNNLGQTISISDFGKNPNDVDSAFGKMYKYGEGENDKNKLTLDGNLMSIKEKENNLIVNGDFSNGLTNWTKINCDNNDKVENGAFKFIGNSNVDKNIGQTLNISGNKGDIFTLATWVNSKAVPNNPDRSIKVSLTIHFIREDGTSQIIDKDVNVDGTGWQFKSEVVIADSNYTNAIVYLVCSYNENETYFDNIGLFKEEFGQSYTYDNNGNIITTQDNAKNEQEFKYNTNNKLIEMIDPKGQNFVYEYDSSNPERLIKAINSVGNSYSFDYDSFGNLTSSKFEENDGGAVKLEYKAHISNVGWLETANDGEKTGSLDYTNQMEAITINVTSDIPNAKVEYQTHVSNIGWQDYVQNGNIAGTTGESLPIEAIKIRLNNLPNYSIKYRTYVEGIGWQDWVKDDEVSGTTGQSKRIYAIQIKLEYVKQNKMYIGTQAEYSSNGKYQTKLTDQLGNSFNYTYNSTGTLLNEVDNNNTKLEYTYDNLDRITKVDLKSSTGNIVSTNEYIYENDKLKTIKVGNTTYEFIYDEFGNTKQVKVGDSILVTNDYEKNNGNLVKESFGNNHVINYAYDRFNRLTTKKGTNGSYTYTYNADSNVKTIVDTINNNTKSFTYDLAQRLVKEINTNGFTKQYEYDIKNNISNIQYKFYDNQDSIQYNYDNHNRLNKIIKNNSVWERQLDSLSRIKKNIISNGRKSYTINYEYLTITGEDNKATTYISKVDPQYENPVEYQYDSKGNIQSRKIGIDINTYYYNEANELIRENNKELDKTIVYTYDSNGNILNKKEYSYTTSNTLPATANKTITYTYGNTNWKDQLTQYDGKQITYDAIGNPLTYDGNNYTWQNGRQLSGISNPTKNQTITYKYNENGIRTQKIVNGETTDYYLDGTKVIYEQIGPKTISYTYDENGNILGLNYYGYQYYYIKNAQNDIIGILNANLNLEVSYTYDSWGNIVSIKDANGNEITDPDNIGLINPYRYRSYRYDTETGLYYLQSRYYNPEWGRFINADNYGGTIGEVLSHNGYAYCKNNPVNMIDENGNLAILTVTLLLVVVLATMTTIPTETKTNLSEGITTAVEGIVNTVTNIISNKKVVNNTKVVTRNITQLKNKNKDKSQDNYWEASIGITGNIVIGQPLKYDEALIRVQSKRDVMCRDRDYAEAIAITFPDAIGPEIDKNQIPGRSYYQHFHIDDKHGHPHIWFYGT